jgi:hypothetical protein
MGDILIRVYCGESVEDKCESQKHPLNEVKRAKKIVESGKISDCYSNSPDFVSAIKYLSEKNSIKSEFFLNGESFGDNIEPIFEDFNKSFTLLDELI